MKRTHPTILVSYYSESPTSEDECEQGGSKGEPSPPNKRPKKSSSSPQPQPQPPATVAAASDAITKKRKLPALAAHLAPSAPLDDPSNHQGRTRTTPHVDGQWAAHVYVPIVVRRGMLRRIVERAVDIARKGDAGTRIDVHTLGGSGRVRGSDSDVVRELHVSLTRPFFLRTHQREEMKRAVRDAARAHPP